jgi:cytochrome c
MLPIALAALLWLPAHALAADSGKYGFGKPVSAEEIAGWDIAVRPDGKGLPPGRGSVAQGQVVYDEKCASCHGTFGESNSYLLIAGGVGSLGTDQPVRSTGAKLARATTLWDYIRRAMPFAAPQSLTADETYALTAYVLNLNDILPADAVLDQDSIVALKLPNRDGYTTAHGLMRRDGKPDTHNTACMTNCVAVVRLSSQIPEYARDAHGDLAEQSRTVATATATAPRTASRPASGDAATLAKQATCMACHGISDKVVGPAFRDVAQKYAGEPGAEARLAAKVRAGGVGAWGNVAMPAQAQVSEGEARTLVRWILAGAR